MSGPATQGAAPISLQSALADPLSASPQAIAQLQRQYGNRAVQRMIQRAESKAQRQSPIGLEGGDVSGDLQGQINSARGGGRLLDKGAAAQIGGAMGADFSGVRVHTGPQADGLNRSLSAKAFTTGSDIFFSQGAYNPGTHSGKQLLAHELTHVVQQGGAKTNRVQTKLTVGPAGDKYEEEADDVAGKVMRSLSVRPGLQRSAARPGRIQMKAAPAGSVQRLFGLSAAEKAKKKDAAQKKDVDVRQSLQDASRYERNLGKYLFTHGKATAAAKTLNTRMLSALLPTFDKDKQDQQKALTDTFGGTAKKYAGTVGKEFADVWGVFQEGNLRERMTAAYNALFGTFKETMHDLMSRSAWEEAEARGFSTRKLKIRKRQLGKWYKGGNLGSKKDSFDKQGRKDIYRDPRNPLDRKNMGSMESGLLMKGTRSMVNEQEENDYKAQFTEDQLKNDPTVKAKLNEFAESRLTDRNVGELNEGPFKAGLSSREKKFMFKDKDRFEDVSGEKLTWEEGASKWVINDKSAWVQRLRNQLKMPLVAGPSGTALRFYQVWEWLSKPMKGEDLRLALLGWMLVENDHSFHEIMQMGADYGLPYTPGQAAYRNIPPLKESELRTNVALDPQYPHFFPDEVTYHRKLDKGEFKLLRPQMAAMKDATAFTTLAGQQFGTDKAGFEGHGLDKMLRLSTAYTSVAYHTQNMISSHGRFMAKRMLNSQLKAARADTDVLEWIRFVRVQGHSIDDEKDDAVKKRLNRGKDRFGSFGFGEKNMALVVGFNPDVTAEELIDETKEHNIHTATSLKMLPKFAGTVYRGEAGVGMPYSKGKTIRINKFFSTTRLETKPVYYARTAAGMKKMGFDWQASWKTKFMSPRILVIESKTGRDVNSVSINEMSSGKRDDPNRTGAIEEVILMPGTTLEVTEGPKTETGKFDGIPFVKLKEVSEGTDEERQSQATEEGALVNSFKQGAPPEQEVEQEKGQLFEATQDISAGTAPAFDDRHISQGETFEVIDDGYPGNVKDPAIDWVRCRYEDKVLYVLAYDLTSLAKPSTGA